CIIGPESEGRPRIAQSLLLYAGHRGELTVAEPRPLDGGEEGRGLRVGRVRETAADRPDLELEGDAPAHLGEKPRGDPGGLLDRRFGNATAKQAEDPPETAVRRGEEPAEDDRGGRPLRMAGRFARLARFVDPGDRGVLVLVDRAGRATVDPREVVEARRPARVLG